MTEAVNAIIASAISSVFLDVSFSIVLAPLTSPMVSIALFLFGLAVGSFINVLSLRYEEDKSIFRRGIVGGRSHCRSCGKILQWLELIPLFSFLLQRGKCRSCRARLSLQYPIVELGTGLLFLGTPYAVYKGYDVFFFQSGADFPGWFIVLTVLFLLSAVVYVFLSAVDARLTIIPDQATILIAGLGIGKIAILAFTDSWQVIGSSFLGHYAALFGFRENIWLNHLLAAVFGAIFFGLIFFLSRGRAMGFGDVKLAAASGLLLGWPDTAVALALAFIVGALWGILLVVRGRREMKSSVPFGPFIVIGIFLIIFFGKHIMDGYFALFP